MSLNILMDATPILPDLWHFSAPRRTRDDKKFVSPRSRTAHPVKYYWADFGLARRYPPDDPNPLEDPIEGGDKSVPEFQQDPIVPCNPFPTDVYYVGNLIREDFLQASALTGGIVLARLMNCCRCTGTSLSWTRSSRACAMRNLRSGPQ